MHTNQMKRTLYVLALTTLCSSTLMAQEKPKPEVLLQDSHNGFVVAVDNKFTKMNGEFANLFGIYGGWLINHQFMIGVGGYGRTTDVSRHQMGYGGFVLEYYINPNRLWNVSVKGLLGAGSSSYEWDNPFFVAEPEVKMTLNLTQWMRLGGGVGYRFVAGAPWHDHDLSGVTASVDLKFGRF